MLSCRRGCFQAAAADDIESTNGAYDHCHRGLLMVIQSPASRSSR